MDMKGVQQSFQETDFDGPEVKNIEHPLKARKGRNHMADQRSRRRRRRPKFNMMKELNFEGSNYITITSMEYINSKYGLKKSQYIEKFIRCIHKKINYDVSKISDHFVENLSPWMKVKLFLLLVTLSERGGPDYWSDKKEDDVNTAAKDKSPSSILQDSLPKAEDKSDKISDIISNLKREADKTNKENRVFTLNELIMKQNINQDFNEITYDENYVFSSIWANFMEGLINHYLERVIVPNSELKVCQQLYKPMMKIISLYNEYNELMEKSEKNGFLPSPSDNKNDTEEKMSPAITDSEHDDIVARERLQRAQNLLWQAREDIPKTISKELTLLSEMYSTLSADEQDYELDEFVCCAEEYIELKFLPSLISLLFSNCGSTNFWKIMLVLEPFFYYIEDINDEDEDGPSDNETDYCPKDDGETNELNEKAQLKPDPRVITLEKICEVAAKQKWI